MKNLRTRGRKSPYFRDRSEVWEVGKYVGSGGAKSGTQVCLVGGRGVQAEMPQEEKNWSQHPWCYGHVAWVLRLGIPSPKGSPGAADTAPEQHGE